MNLARCRRCRQVILWVDSATTGRPVPLDAAPAADGNVALGQAGATFLSAEQAETGRMLGTRRYKPHLCRKDLKRRGTSTPQSGSTRAGSAPVEG